MLVLWMPCELCRYLLTRHAAADSHASVPLLGIGKLCYLMLRGFGSYMLWLVGGFSTCMGLATVQGFELCFVMLALVCCAVHAASAALYGYSRALGYSALLLLG